MKTIARFVGVAMVLGLVAGASSAQAATFSRDLTVGSRGADVTALQDALIAKTYLAAGYNTGYFGGLTKAALAKWQAANGIAPAAGYFGPKTRAAMSAAPEVTPTPTSTPVSTLSGVGTLDVTNYTTDVQDDINTGSSEKVLGFRGEASDGDVQLSHVKLSVNYAGSQSNRITRYFDSFDVVMNGKTVATVDAADFNRDSAGNYSKTIALSNAVIKKGSSNKATFYVVAHAVESVDSNDATTPWTVSASNFRYEDATGAVLTVTADDVTNSGVNVVKLSTSSDVKAKFSAGSNNPDQASVLVDEDTSGTLVTLLEFRIKAEGTDESFDTARFDVVTSGTTSADMVSEFQLVKGSNVIESTSSIPAGANIAVAFNLSDEEKINQDDTATYKLVAKMNKNTDGKFSGSTITATASTTAFGLTDANGDVISLSRYSGSAVGNTQTIRGKGVILTKSSVDSTMTSSLVNNTTLKGAQFTYVVKVTADGDDVYFPDSAASTTFAMTKDSVSFSTSTTNALASVSGATKVSGQYRINDGETATLTYTVNTNTGLASGVYKGIISSFNYNTTGVLGTYGKSEVFTPVDTFTTPSVTITN